MSTDTQVAGDAAVRRKRSKWTELAPSIGLFIAVAVIWEVSVRAFAIPAYLLPAPSVIAAEMIAKWPMLMTNLYATMLAAVLGFAVGTSFAVALAILFLYSRTAERALFPWAITLKTIPILAIAPLLTIWLGFGLAPKVAIAGLICFFPTLVNTVKGLKSIDRQAHEFLNVVGATRAQVFRHARLYAAMPYTFAAAKISSSMAVIGAIVAEFTGANKGIGTLIVTAGYQMDATLLFAAIVASSIATIALFYIVSFVERLCLYWPEARIDV